MAGNLCYFKPKVVYEETKQDIPSNKISGMNILSIYKPADRIELQSRCTNSAACVFTVETSDVATWSGLMFQGATHI